MATSEHHDDVELPDYLAGSEHYNPSTPIEQLEERIEELEEHVSRLQQSSQSAGIGLYGLGSIIAVVLSWSRNASILWCILHGILSWIYVIYFAVTR